jgi:predicted nucleic acid-binding protein
MRFVIDTNVLIEAYRRYYAFDLAPKFWSEIVNHVGNDHIVCVDRVQAELIKGNDELAKWIKNCGCYFLPTADAKTIDAYGKLMQWVAGEIRFTPQARSEFATVADAWIVAFAAAHGDIVTTLEMPAINSKKKIKIPDACNALSVPYVDTFVMLKRLGVKFM